jgi:hypothetical protein
MTEVFREESQDDSEKGKGGGGTCVDAIHVSGTFIQTIENYVGGNTNLIGHCHTHCIAIVQKLKLPSNASTTTIG